MVVKNVVYYLKKYDDYYKEMKDEYIGYGGDEDDFTCMHEGMTADEIVGYYFHYYNTDALMRWNENVAHISMDERTELDHEVQTILDKLYDARMAF